MSNEPDAAGHTPFAFHWQRDAGTAIAWVAGELDMMTAPQLSAALMPILGDPPATLKLDVSRLTFVASAGLAAILECWQGCRERGTGFLLVNPSSRMRRVLSMAGLDGVFPVVVKQPGPGVQRQEGT